MQSKIDSFTYGYTHSNSIKKQIFLDLVFLR